MLNRNLLRGAIASAGYTQEKLAASLDMANCTLTSRMNGTTFFDLEEIDRICELLHIDDDKTKIAIFLSSPSQKQDEPSKTA